MLSALRSHPATVRLVAVVVGGLFVLKSGEDHLTLEKFAYALVLAAVVSAAAIRAARAGLREARRSHLLRELGPGSVVVLALLAVSFPVARANDTDLSSWFRDAASYALFAAVPLLAWDFDRELGVHRWRARPVIGLFVLAGSTSTISFALDFLGRRRIADVRTEGLILGSFLLGAALFAFALAMGLDRGRLRFRWIALAAFLFCVLFLAGSRSALILLAAAAVLLIPFVRVASQVSPRRTVGPLAVVASAVVFASAAIAALPPGDSGFGRLSDRFRSIPALVTDPWNDESISLRRAQWAAAWDVFLENPVIGAGAGYRFEWPYPYSPPFVRRGSTIDSPLGFLAKFGLVGLLAIVVVVAGYVRFLRLLLVAEPRSPESLALLVFTVVLVAYFPLGVPIEDKGSSLGLLFLLLLAVAGVRRSEEQERPDSRPKHTTEPL